MRKTSRRDLERGGNSLGRGGCGRIGCILWMVRGEETGKQFALLNIEKVVLRPFKKEARVKSEGCRK